MDDEEIAPVETLPDEVLLTVLAFLRPEDLVATLSVSRRWRLLSGSPALWRRVRLVYELHTSPSSPFCRALRAAPVLEEIVFKNSHLPGDVIDAILAGCSSARVVSFVVAPVVPVASLCSLLRHFGEDVQELTLSYQSRGAGAGALFRTVAAMRNLRVLRLGDYPGHACDDGNPLVDGCPELHEVDLERFAGPPAAQALVYDLLRGRASTLRAFSFPRRQYVTDDRVVKEILPRCVNLESVGMGFDCVECLSTLPDPGQLRCLKLWYTYADPSDASLQFLTRSRCFARVEHLSMELDLGNVWGPAVVQACPRLKVLQLSQYGSQVRFALPDSSTDGDQTRYVNVVLSEAGSTHDFEAQARRVAAGECPEDLARFHPQKRLKVHRFCQLFAQEVPPLMFLD